MYIKFLYPEATAILPHTRGTRTYIQNPKVQYLEPNRVYRLDLGLWLPYLPADTIVKLIDIHPRFSLLNHYWTASGDQLRLLILTNSTTILEPHTDVCRIVYVPTTSLSPGDFFSLFHTIK
jgi:hypothetical protein